MATHSTILCGSCLSLISDELAVGEAGKLLIAFKNTLPTEMKDVTLNIDIDGLSTGKGVLKHRCMDTMVCEPVASCAYVQGNLCVHEA